jgi:hypothetical protein
MIIKVFNINNKYKSYKYIIPLKHYTIIVYRDNNIRRDKGNPFKMNIFKESIKYRLFINDNLYKMLLSEDNTILKMAIDIIINKI